MEDLRKNAVAELFATHPTVNTFYVTSDNTGFTEDHRAEAHAQSLEDKKVQPYNRTVFETLISIQDKVSSKVSKIETRVKAIVPVIEVETDDQKTDEGDGDPGAGAGAENPEGAGDPGANQNPGTGAAATSVKTELSEKEQLQARYLELFGKKPNHLTGVEKLKADIAAKEAETK